jgi:hypothetical protein
MLLFLARAGLPDGMFVYQFFAILVYFGRPWKEEYWYIYFTALWNILRSIGIVIWYFFRFVTKISGNPEPEPSNGFLCLFQSSRQVNPSFRLTTLLRAIHLVRRLTLTCSKKTGSYATIGCGRKDHLHGCQIFLDTTYQNEGKCTKLPLHYQMAIKYTI